MKPLKIFQIASHDCLERGGAVQMFRLCRGLKNRGHEVRCIFHTRTPPEKKTLEAQRIFNDAGLKLELFDMNSLGAMRRFRKLYRAERPDVVHVHRELALGFVFFSTLLLRLPCFVTNRGTIYKPKWKTFERRILKSRKLKRVICVSHAVRDALLEQTTIRKYKAVVVYGGVVPEEFPPETSGFETRKRFGVPKEAPLIVHCGSLAPKKGIHVLFDAFMRLSEDDPEVRLLLVGGGKHSLVREFIRENHLSDKVKLAGHESDIAPILAAGDVIVSASTKGEGLTGVIREALCMARPVVCTAVAGNPEMVRDRITGWLVRPDDAADLADGIRWTLDHPNEARTLAEAGRQWVLENCEEKVRSERVETIYNNVLEDRTLKGKARLLKAALNRMSPSKR